MRIDYDTDMYPSELFTKLDGGTPFQCLESRILFIKIDNETVFDPSSGRVLSMGTADPFLRVFPRHDAVIVFSPEKLCRP